MTGLFTPGNLIANFFLFLITLVIIAILAVIGAMFVGVFVSHRIFSVKAFTPFEKEMLKMREEVGVIAQEISKMRDEVKQIAQDMERVTEEKKS